MERIESIENKENNKKKENKELLEGFLNIVAGIVIAKLIIVFLFSFARVNGDSMTNNFYNNEIVGMERISIKMNNINRYDVVIVQSDALDELIIKRVYGLPGETVSVKDNGKIFIDGKEINDPYAKKEPYYGPAVTRVLGKSEYFVMGDNRNNSEDSRYDVVGAIDSSKIQGKVCIAFSVKKSYFGLINNKTNHNN